MPINSASFVLRCTHAGDTFEVFFRRDLSVESILVFPATRPLHGVFIALKDCPWPIRELIEKEQGEVGFD